MSKTPRSRTLVDQTETVESVVQRSTDGVEFNVGTQTAYSGDREMNDYVDSSFHLRRRQGEVFNNSCELTVSKKYHVNPSGSLTYWDTSYPENKYTLIQGNVTDWGLARASYYGPFAPNTSGIVGSAVDDAKLYALAQVDSTPYEFFEDLAEIGETIRFLRSPLQSIRQVIKAYKRKKRRIEASDFSNAGEKAKALAGLWNQYRFALSPLIRSVMSAVEAFDKFKDLERPPRRSAHGFGKEFSDPVVDTYEPWFSYGPTDTVKIRYDKVSEVQTEAHASIYYEVTNPVVDWKFALGLRLKDIPVVAWEIVPLSFMVDRLINIKAMISGLVNLADPNVTILAASCTTKSSVTVNVTATDIWSSYGTFAAIIGGTDSVCSEQFTYDRDIWQPSIKDTIPGFHPRGLIDDVVKILDLLAIITSLSRL